MAANAQQQVLKKRLLTTAEQTDVVQLARLCDSHDGLHTRLDINMLSAPSEDMPCDYLYYVDARLVGYLSLDKYHQQGGKEVMGMVRPGYRRRGIFTALLHEARRECQAYSIPRILLVCEASSASGRAFLETLDAAYRFSEHRMLLGQFHDHYRFDDRLTVRPANAGDREHLVTVLATERGGDREQASQHLADILRRPDQTYYLATLGIEGVSCEEPVGVLRVEEAPQELAIYGFLVHPAYRHRGYGRQLLEDTLRELRRTSPKPIVLEVDTDNTPALNLYYSVGFRVECTYEYYGWEV